MPHGRDLYCSEIPHACSNRRTAVSLACGKTTTCMKIYELHDLRDYMLAAAQGQLLMSKTSLGPSLKSTLDTCLLPWDWDHTEKRR